MASLTALVMACLPCAAVAGAMTVSSPAFDDQGTMPARFTCDGAGISPGLHWTGVPGKARSLALMVADPDAPNPKAPRGTWIHWVLYDIPPSANGLARDISPAGLPGGSRQGLNSWQRKGYGAPCPPIGRHHYVFTLYALDVRLPDLGVPNAGELERAMAGHILARAQIVGTYQRRR